MNTTNQFVCHGMKGNKPFLDKQNMKRSSVCIRFSSYKETVPLYGWNIEILEEMNPYSYFLSVYLIDVLRNMKKGMYKNIRSVLYMTYILGLRLCVFRISFGNLILKTWNVCFMKDVIFSETVRKFGKFRMSFQCLLLQGLNSDTYEEIVCLVESQIWTFTLVRDWFTIFIDPIKFQLSIWINE